MVFYSEIICGKPIRPDWKHLFNEETLSGENATPKLFLALIDILTYPACAEDYENAPFLDHDNIFEAAKFHEPMERIFSDIVEFFGKIYKA